MAAAGFVFAFVFAFAVGFGFGFRLGVARCGKVWQGKHGRWPLHQPSLPHNGLPTMALLRTTPHALAAKISFASAVCGIWP